MRPFSWDSETVPERKLTKPEAGHQKKAGIDRVPEGAEGVRPEGQRASTTWATKLTADAFAAGDFVDVTGISKGHGYQGVIKRHGAHRLKETHGSGPVVRHAGSMGANSSPSKIFKGKIGAGQMGDEQVTVQNLDVVKVDPELQPDRGPRRHSRPQGRHRVREEHCQDSRGEEGPRRRHQQQPAEGFRTCQPAEGLRPQQVRKGECKSWRKQTCTTWPASRSVRSSSPRRSSASSPTRPWSTRWSRTTWPTAVRALRAL